MNIGNSFNTQNLNYLNENRSNINEALSKIGAARELSGKDGAEYLVSNKLASQISTLTQSVQNENESIGMYQVADGALNALNDNAQRLNELSVSFGNGALNASQKNMLFEEFQATKDAMKSIAETTSYNGQSLMQGDLSVDGISKLSIENQEGIDSFMQNLDALSSNVSANINKSEVSIANSLSAVSNLTSSNAEISEKPMDEKINDLKQNEIKLQSSVMSQVHQQELLQKRVAALLV